MGELGVAVANRSSSAANGTGSGPMMNWIRACSSRADHSDDRSSAEAALSATCRSISCASEKWPSTRWISARAWVRAIRRGSSTGNSDLALDMRFSEAA